MSIKLILIFLLTINICSSKKNDLAKDIGQEIHLYFKEKGIINDNGNQIEVEFVNLVEYSICPDPEDPEDARGNCLWAGRAVVEIRIGYTSTSAFGSILRLGIGDLFHANCASSIEYRNYRITLVSVKRNGNSVVYEAKYKIGIRVDRK